MTHNSDGEVFGAKALNLTVIGLSLLVLMGLFWQPAPARVVTASPTAQTEQVAKTPASAPTAG